ncbi:hypothetical protein K4K59_012041 [Colletotrichum sp. SAR11_240]|nr:hypothetical protein K4K59_012041 [Colletotrichum sp. SAR11_240]
MSTEDHRWVFETGDFADFRIVCTDDGVEFNVHRLMLSLHSTYFARLFKSEFQETKLGISNLADVDSQTMGHLLDFFYRGNTPWKCPDDMIMLAKLWILADRLQATSAMIEVEHRVKRKLNGLSNKFIVADCTLLDTVFHHKACAESGLGYAVGEAACAILIDRSQYPKKSDLVEKHARENILSANMMLFWASRYKENSNTFEAVDRGRLEIPAEYDLNLVRTLMDCFYRGETEWVFPEDDIRKNVELWILAEWLNVEYAMHTIEVNLLEILSPMEQKYRAAKPWMLELVFEHRKCGNSTVGIIFAEAALAVRYTTGKADHIRCLDDMRNVFPALGRKMDEWEVQYRERSDELLGSGGYGWRDEAVIALQPLRRHMVENRLGIAASEGDFVTKRTGNSVPLLSIHSFSLIPNLELFTSDWRRVDPPLAYW